MARDFGPAGGSQNPGDITVLVESVFHHQPAAIGEDGNATRRKNSNIVEAIFARCERRYRLVLQPLKCLVIISYIGRVRHDDIELLIGNGLCPASEDAGYVRETGLSDVF